MSRIRRLRKMRSTLWTESELKELKQLSDPQGKWLIDNLTKSDFLTMMRCFKSMALEKGDEEDAKFYGYFLDYLGTTHDPKPKEWKVFASLVIRIPKTIKGI